MHTSWWVPYFPDNSSLFILRKSHFIYCPANFLSRYFCRISVDLSLKNLSLKNPYIHFLCIALCRTACEKCRKDKVCKFYYPHDRSRPLFHPSLSHPLTAYMPHEMATSKKINSTVSADIRAVKKCEETGAWKKKIIIIRFTAVQYHTSQLLPGNNKKGDYYRFRTSLKITTCTFIMYL